MPKIDPKLIKPIKPTKTVSFPPDVLRDISQIMAETPGCRFSPLVVDLVKRGLDSLRAAQKRRHPMNCLEGL